MRLTVPIFVVAITAAGFGSAQVVTTLAGKAWTFPGDGKPAISAPIDSAAAAAFDAQGNFYFVDINNNILARVDANGILKVIAGNGIPGYSGDAADGGSALNASLAEVQAMVVDPQGNIYLAEASNFEFSDFAQGLVRKISKAGIITTIAGLGTSPTDNGDGGPASKSSLIFPFALALDPAGNLYIADIDDNRVRRITPDGSIATVAGTGTDDFSGDGGAAVKATLSSPAGVATDADGNLYIADSGNQRIRRVGTDGKIATIAGTGVEGFSGDGGPASAAKLDTPGYLASDAAGNLFFDDSGNNRIRRISLAGNIDTVAGNGLAGNSGDGGPALQAAVSDVSAVAVANDGSVYIASQDYFGVFDDVIGGRVRKFTPGGAISLVSGSGTFRFGGDGGAGKNAFLNEPSAIVVGADGSVFVADTNNNRVRKIAPDGTISTVAGNGAPAFAGDGGPGPSASLNGPQGLAMDASGNLFIADTSNNVVRRLDPTGIITTVAGTSRARFSGDGGPAKSAALNFPEDLAFDPQGTLYIVDAENYRIRKVTPDGTISTFAGTGNSTLAGDGGPASAASFESPEHIAADLLGDIFVTDEFSSVIRKIDSTGKISTFSMQTGGPLAVDRQGALYVAGGGTASKVNADGSLTLILGEGSTAVDQDGVAPLDASLSSVSGIAFDGKGQLYFTEDDPGLVRAVTSPTSSGSSPTFTVTPSSLSFTAASNGITPPSSNLVLQSTVSGLQFTVALTNDGPFSFLRASALGGVLPGSLPITADPTGIDPGTYTGNVVVNVPKADPSQRSVSVPVTFTVTAPPPAHLGVDQSTLNFSSLKGGSRVDRQLRVLNTGSGLLSFTATASTDSGGSWLRVSAPSGTSSAPAPGIVAVTVLPGTLDPATYRGVIQIKSTTTNETAAVSVVLTISAKEQILLLSQTGLTFTTVQDTAVPPQTIGILNLGKGLMDWTVTASTLSGGSGWLSVSPSSGTTDAASLSVPLVQVAIDPTGLAPSEYYGQLSVVAPGAVNTPQTVSIVLRVLAPGSNPGPLVRPTGLIFTGIAGGSSDPAPQTVLVANVTASPVTYTAGRLTSDGADWIAANPAQAAVPPGGTVPLLVTVKTAGLDAGVHRGVVTLLFSDGSVQPIAILFVLQPGAATPSPANKSRAGEVREAGCAARVLLPVFSSLTAGFQQPEGWPTTIEVRVADDCGNLQTDGSVTISFDDGEPQLPLNSLKNGIWQGTWRTASQQAVTLTANAQDVNRNLTGSAQLTGQVVTNPSPPQIAEGGIVNAAEPGRAAPVAPGSAISIFGAKLFDGDPQTSPFPLQFLFAGTRITVAGRFLPIAWASSTQINAILPYDLPSNTSLSLIVQRDNTLSVPATIVVASAQPAIYVGGPGNQGAIFDAGVLADANNPASALDSLVIYATGLGGVDATVDPAVGAPGNPPARATQPVTVTIGGKSATVQFAGLAPGFTGLYQVNVSVPQGITPGPTVPVVLTVANQDSDPVMIAIH